MSKINYKKGIIGIFIVIVSTVALLSYLGIDVRGIAEKPEVKKGIAYVSEISKNIWDKYLKQNVSVATKYISDNKLIEKGAALTFDSIQKIVSVGKTVKNTISSN